MALMSCPDSESLERLLQGRIPAAEAEQLEEHLLHCDTCSATANSLTVNDEIVEALRNRRVFEGDEEIVAQAIQRGKQLRGESETVDSIEETATFDMRDQTPDPAAEVKVVATTPEPIDFLHPPQQPDEIGRLGDYRVLQVLGVGGMGVVFRAEDPKLERLIALKAMKPNIAASELAKDRFLREAKATAAIDHDNIVQIYQVGEDGNVPFIAMRFLRGESLQTRLKREGKLDQREVVRIGREIAAGLGAAHKCELIHRDIKPDNIWIEEEGGRVKILDFGLVRTTTDDVDLTQSGTVLGTPRYMAPEQALGQEVDSRCDLFSLGSVLFHIVSGEAPFNGSNLSAILVAVAHKDPRPLKDLCSDVDAGLADLIMRLLQKDPDKRPQSAAEITDALCEIEKSLDLVDGEAIGSARLAVPQIVAEKPARTRIASRSVAGTSSKPKRKSSGTQSGGAAAPLLTRPRVLLLCAATVGLSIFIALWAACVIFKVESEHGTLVVKVTGDDFATSVQGKEVTIKNTETNKTIRIDLNSSEETATLKPGQYQFLFTTDSGLTAKTDRFTIRRGKNEVVEVWWEPKVTKGVVGRTESTLKHVPFDLLYEVPQPVIGIREIPATVFDSDRPELYLDANATNDVSQLRIFRLWFQTEDLVPSETNSNLYLPRTIKAWVRSETAPQGSVEVVDKPSNAKMVCVRPRSPLADGIYCIMEGRIGDGAKLPRFSAPFTIRGVGKPIIDMTSVSVKADQVVLKVKIRNQGKGALNDGRLVVTLQRVTSGQSVFSGRFQPKLPVILSSDTRDVELEVSTAETPPGRYYFTIAVRQTHWNGDQNELTEGNSNEFEIPPNAPRAK